jgi:hypothetical protein
MATSNLKEFNAGLDQFYKKDVEGFASMAVRRVAFAIDRAVVMGTPVGNPSLWKRKAPKGYVGGRARANWIPTLGVPHTGTVDRIDKQGAATIALLAPVTADFRLGQTIWISNSLPYIVPLNNGHSTQAPAGYVEMAVQEGLRAAFR